MKAEQDIEKQLSAVQDAWDSNPPADLWDRLEERLDAASPSASPRKPKNWPFRIVGAFLAIGIGLATWGLWPSNELDRPFARPLAMHSLTAASRANGASSATPAAHNSSRLSFGTNLGIGNARPTGTAGLLDEPSGGMFQKFSQTRLGLKGATELHFGDPKAADDPMDAQAALNGSAVQVNGMAFDYNVTASNMYAGRPELELQYHVLPAGNMLVTNSVGNPIDTVHSLEQYSSLMRSADNNRYLQINAARNDMNFNFADPSTPRNQQNLQHLKWLLGSWKTQGASGGAIEEWRQMDEFTLLGRGYFVVNGDTIVTQEMRIEQRGPNVYYIIAKDENAKAMKFRLRSRAGNELIFQDESPKTNHELVLRNNPATNEVEKIITTPAERSAQLKSTHPENQSPNLRKVMQRSQRP